MYAGGREYRHKTRCDEQRLAALHYGFEQRQQLVQRKSLATELDVVEGVQFDRGYISLYFVTNADKMRAEMEDACILINEKFWLFVAIGASYTAFQMAVSIGLGVRIAAQVAALLTRP
jgi:hypothetical protein